MRDFFSTIHCACGLHCRLCRDLEAGRKWRKAMLRLFPLEVETRPMEPETGRVEAEPDFDCPQGKPWGFTGSAEHDKRQPICRACERYQGEKCSLYPGRRCRWESYMKTPGAVCPADPPRW